MSSDRCWEPPLSSFADDLSNCALVKLRLMRTVIGGMDLGLKGDSLESLA